MDRGCCQIGACPGCVPFVPARSHNEVALSAENVGFVGFGGMGHNSGFPVHLASLGPPRPLRRCITGPARGTVSLTGRPTHNSINQKVLTMFQNGIRTCDACEEVIPRRTTYNKSTVQPERAAFVKAVFAAAGVSLWRPAYARRCPPCAAVLTRSSGRSLTATRIL
jgi:hypothetical protein